MDVHCVPIQSSKAIMYFSKNNLTLIKKIDLHTRFLDENNLRNLQS